MTDWQRPVDDGSAAVGEVSSTQGEDTAVTSQLPVAEDTVSSTRDDVSPPHKIPALDMSASSSACDEDDYAPSEVEEDDDDLISEEDDAEDVGELDALEQEGDIPLEQLMAMYSGAPPAGPSEGSPAGPSGDITAGSGEERLVEAVKTEDGQVLVRGISITMTAGTSQESDEEDSSETPAPSLGLDVLTAQGELADSESDADYDPLEDLEAKWRRFIRVGDEFQSRLPSLRSDGEEEIAYENEDHLLWSRSSCSEHSVEEYLSEIGQLQGQAAGAQVRDDEQSLYLLLRCGHNVSEAVRRKRLQPVMASPDALCMWSEEEARNFETGLRLYGKDFHMVQLKVVRTRSVAEIINFYYLWKKTERHDAFVSKYRLGGKQKSTSTDLMTQFIDELENGAGQVRSLEPAPPITTAVAFSVSRTVVVTTPVAAATTTSSISPGSRSSSTEVPPPALPSPTSHLSPRPQGVGERETTINQQDQQRAPTPLSPQRFARESHSSPLKATSLPPNTTASV